LLEALPKVLTDRISVGMDDLMPHFLQRPVSVSRHFPFIKIFPIFLPHLIWLAGWVMCWWGRDSQSRKVGEIFL